MNGKKTKSKPILSLSIDRIELANYWFYEVSSVGTSDIVLDLLAEKFPDNNIESVLIKCVAVNSLYGTNVLAIYNAAEHVTTELASPYIDYDDDEFIKRLATISVIQKGETRELHLISFASKYAHFFINSEKFPMYDSYAMMMIKAHIAKDDMKKNPMNPYIAFKENFLALKGSLGLQVSTRALDHYLWFSGQLKTWQKDHESQINVGLKDLFNSKEQYFKELWLDVGS